MSQLRRSRTPGWRHHCRFCRTQKPAADPGRQKKLRALLRHLEALKKNRTQQSNRLSTCGDEEVRASILTLLQVIDGEIAAMKQRLTDFSMTTLTLKQARLVGVCHGAAKHRPISWPRCTTWSSMIMPKPPRRMRVLPPLTTFRHISRPKMSRMGKASIRSALSSRLSQPFVIIPSCGVGRTARKTQVSYSGERHA